MADLSTQINLNPVAQPAAPAQAIPSATPIGVTPQEAAALDAPVHVLDPYGRPGQVPASQLGLAKSQGYTEAGAPPPEQQGVYDAALAKGFSPTLARGLSLASPYLSWEQGLMGGATAGLAEGAQRKIAGVVGPIVSKAIGGPEMTQDEAEAYWKDLAQGGAHPWVHGAGEASGLVASSVAAPYLRGAGAAAKGAGVVGRGLGLLSEAGQGAAAGAKALTGGLAARGALGRAASTGAQFAAQGAIETGLYTGVHELSEEMFGKPEISAEKILGAASDGAYGGAILGGALGAGGSLGKSAVTGTRDMVQGIAAKNADALQGFADEQRWRALSPNKKFTTEAERRFPGGAKGLGNLMGAEGLNGESFMQAVKEGDVATILGKTDDAIARVGVDIGESRAASTAKVLWGDIDDAIEKVAAPLRKSELLSDKLAKVNEIRSQLATDFLQGNEASLAVQRGEMGLEEGVAAMRAHEIPLQDVVARRQILDDLFYNEVKTLDPKMRVALMRDLRGNLEETIMKSFGEAAEASGDKFARASLESLKRRYQGLSIIRDTARSSAAGAASNRAIGLTDYVTMAGFGGGLTGLAAGAANRFMRSRGNSIAAAAADRIAAFGGKQRVTFRMADEASALANMQKEAAVADGVPSGAAEAPVAEIAVAEPAIEIPAKADRSTEFTYQKEWNPETTELLSATSPTPPEEMAKGMKEIFGDKIPTADDWYKMWKLPDGYSVHFDNMELFRSPAREGSLPQLSVEMHISNPEGDTVGDLFRSFSRDDKGRLVAGHDYMTLNPEVQGQGIASAMTKSSFRAYKDIGVDKVDIHAALSAGPYTWARQGFQWDAEQATEMAEKIQEYVTNKYGNPALADELAQKAYEGPRAVSEMKVGEENIGKPFLLQSGGWLGFKDVAAARAEREAARAAQDASHAAATAEAASKAAEFERVHRAIAHVDQQVDSAAKGLVTGVDSSAPFKASRAAGKDVYRTPFEATRALTAQYVRARDDVNRMQRDVSHVARDTGLPSMPTISASMAGNAMRATAYISSQLPQPIGSPALGEDMPHTVTDADMHAFLDKYEVARNPMSALRNIAKGRISSDQVDALKVIYPQLFSQLQVSSLTEVRNRQAAGKPLNFEVRQRLANLLGVHTDPSQEPDMAKLLQANIANSQQGKVEGMGPKMKPGRAVSLPASLGATRYDRLESLKR